MIKPRYRRRSIRLRGYDYTGQGAYFLTICTYQQCCILGEITDDTMITSPLGDTVQRCWAVIPDHYPRAVLDAFVVMPNHLHGIIALTDEHNTVGATHGSPLPATPLPATPPPATPLPATPPPAMPPPATPRPRGPKPHSIGAIVGQFKSSVSRITNRQPNPPDHPTWQRNYYEHIIRNPQALNAIRAYIANNPRRWANDTLYAQLPKG